MKLVPFNTNVIVRPLKKSSKIILTDSAGQEAEYSYLARVEAVGHGYFDGEKWVEIPYKKGDLVAVNPQGIWAFKIDDTNYFRMNMDAIMCRVDDYDTSAYEELK